jgi:hypothetical protein
VSADDQVIDVPTAIETSDLLDELSDLRVATAKTTSRCWYEPTVGLLFSSLAHGSWASQGPARKSGP